MSKILQRVTNIVFAVLLATFSVNLAGVLSLQTAHADRHDDNGTYQPVWCKLTGSGWQAQLAANGNGKDGALLMTDSIRNQDLGNVDGTVLNGNQVYAHDRDSKLDAACAQQFTLTTPTPVVTGVCGLNNDTVTVPSNPHYTWSFSGWTASKGTVTVTAVSPYSFASGNQVTIPVTEVNTANCTDATAAITPVPATCDVNGSATFAVSHATLTSNGGILDQTPGMHTATFTADAGHAFADGSTTLVVNYTIPAMLTGEQCAGPQPEDEHETRVVTGEPVCLPNGGGTVTSWTEERTRTYSFDEEADAWVAGPWSAWTKVEDSETTRPATNEECPAPCVPSTVTLQQLTLSALNTPADNCTPGQGGAGGETPTTPTPAAPVAELPQTGPADGNTALKLATIIVAGIATYGAMYVAVNRRSLLQK